MNKEHANAVEFAKFKKDLIEIIENTEYKDKLNLILIFEEDKFCEGCDEKHGHMVMLAHSSDAFTMECAKSMIQRVVMRGFGMSDGNEWGHSKQN